MHIILVSDRLTTAKTIVLTWRHLFMATAALVASVIGLSSLFSYVTVRHAADLRLPFVQELLQAANAEENRVSHQFVRENLNAMAVRLGEMQAQLMRLDSMGERLAGLVGVKPHELGVATAGKGGRGGPLIQPVPLSADDLSKAVESLSLQVEAKADALSFLENQLLDERIRQNQLPTSLPLDSRLEQLPASAGGLIRSRASAACTRGSILPPMPARRSGPPPPASSLPPRSTRSTAMCWISTMATTW